VASVTARVFQSGLGTVLSRRPAETEAKLLQDCNSSGGGPPAWFRRRFEVESWAWRGHDVYTVGPSGGGDARGQALYFCGGGYVNRPVVLHWRFIAHLVKAFGVRCSVPLYPLAPQHQCDEGLAFANEVYRRVVGEYGTQRLVVMGDSAGGGLALAMVQHNDSAPARLILNCPWLDAAVSDPSQIELERGDWLLNRFILRAWGRWWAGSRDLEDPIVSPLFGNLSNLPPTLVFGGSLDILVADARRLAAAAPARVTYVEEPGLMHTYPLFGFLPETRRAWREIGAFCAGVWA
jgi:monoterpene epsilon-lactone hydrolase